MAVELDVRLNALPLITDLLEKSRAALSRILNSPDVPVLRAQRPHRGELMPVTSDQLAPRQMLLISTGEDVCGTVSIIITEIGGAKVEPAEDDETGLWAGIKVETRVPGAYALAVSVAAAAADGGYILDERLFWSQARRIQAATLVEGIALQERSSDLLQASEAFYQRIPGSGEDDFRGWSCRHD